MIKRSIIEHHALDLIVDAVECTTRDAGNDNYIGECACTIDYISGVCDLISRINKELSKEKCNG